LVPTIYSNLLVATTNPLNLKFSLVFFTLGTLPIVEDGERVREKSREGSELDGLMNGYLLQLKDLRVG